MLIKGGGGLEEEEEEELERKHQEKEKDEEKEELEIRSKREAGVFSGETPSSNVLWKARLEKKVDGGSKGGHHRNGFQHNKAKRRVFRRFQVRGMKTDRRRNRRTTKEKDWNTLPDIWMALGKQVKLYVSYKTF